MIIKSDIISNTKVSIFTNAYVHNSMTATIIDCLTTIPDHIKYDYYKLRDIQDEIIQKREKLKFPLFVPSAVCGDESAGVTTRKQEFVIAKNNIICIDIDQKDNPWLDMDKVKKACFSLPFVYSASTSIRGKGIFLLIPILDINKLEAHFRSLISFFADNKIICDTKCGDLTRARFMSYDPEQLIKTGDVEVYSVMIEEDPLSQEIREYHAMKNSMRYPDEVDANKLSSALEMLDDIGYTTSDDYYGWLHDGFLLGALTSVLGFSYCCDKFVSFSSRASSFKSRYDVEEKFKNLASTTHKTSSSAAGYFFKLLKDKYGSNWQKELTDYMAKKQS